MFKPVSSKLEIKELEESVLQFWKQEEIFKQTMKKTDGGPNYVFYEGPPTANGIPGVHHVLARVFKDIFPRYKTMQGYHVDRRGGWDTHGLPVEIEVEKKLGFTNKQQIEEYGIEKFNKLCKESAFSYIQEWEKLTDRIAYWVDLSKAYVTYRNEYIESVWWILKNFWDKELLYQGFKVVPYCTRCGTPLSDHEVSLGYHDISEPSIFVRMPLLDEEDTSLLVWTTTPWTLPANVAVAAGKDITYVKVERNLTNGESNTTEKLILAEVLVEKVFSDEKITILERFKGKQLKGKRYQPLFTFLPVDKPAHYVVLGDFVTIADGSGLVHIAPAYGADDMNVANQENLPLLMTVKPDGTFIKEVDHWAGKYVKDADPLIIDHLNARGLLFKVEQHEHSYPFCWRCDTPLLYYARPTWYIRTSEKKDRLVALNNEINWYPEHIKNGRFGNWLENNIDWALGRERFWGTPLPVWQCRDCGLQTCVGSIEELSSLVGHDLTGLELHRPYVDEVTLECPECHGKMQRVPELIDVWFDSGSMPVAQWHYPFEHEKEFKEQYPADYICEAVDQTRGWFYSLHAISTLLFDQKCFKNVLCLGLILDENGQKMSKSKGNVVDPWEVIDQNGADAMRWYLYTASPPGQERRFSANLVSEVIRNFTLTLWNTYSFFVTYANLDNWQPDATKTHIEYSALDKWILSELHTLIKDVTEAFENYDVINATRPVEQFVDQLSNWYLRRSRRRFWKSESDEDKYAAYATLYEALAAISKLIAPSMPYMAEVLYQNLVLSVDANAEKSVHLTQWPDFDEALIDATLNHEMEVVMKLVSLGHAARNKSGIKVRQPLAEAAFALSSADDPRIVEKYAELLEDELNVKKVRLLSAANEAVAYDLVPLPKQLGQKYKGDFPQIKDAILALNAEEIAEKVGSGGSFKVTVAGSEYEINPDEVEIHIQAKEGFEVASEGAYLAALVTTLNEELVNEGLVREFIRRVQEARKQAGFEIADRITLAYSASEKLQQAIEQYRDYVMAETLTVEMTSEDQPHILPNASDDFDGEQVTIWLTKKS
ncbi:MAG: isoleucine--tRNA ligase [Chloroflexi bacterium]|nr:isoleucine--tRNA ligase [Chloroflexota bacterium]